MLYANHFIELLQKSSGSDITALVKNGQTITVADLLAESIALAQSLRAQGMQEGDMCVIATVPGPDFLRIIYATMMLRARVAIIDPEMGRDNYHAKLKQLQPKWAFTDYRLLLLQEHPIIRFFYLRSRKNGLYMPYNSKIQTVATGGWMPILQKHLSISKLVKKGNRTAEFTTKDEAHDYIITYTSGTAAEPKGVVHTIQSLQGSINHIVKLLGDPAKNSIATHLPHFMLIGVCAGIPVHIWDYEWPIEKKLAFLEENQISTLFGPPADYLELMSHCDATNRKLPTCLKHLILGSAPIHVPFLERLIKYVAADVQITCMYGMTEHLIVSAADGRAKITYDCDGDLLGKPMPGVTLRTNTDEELELTSNQLFQRYWHLKDRPEYHSTGDLGYLDDNGMIILTGRKKDMIIRKNFNLYPALYEPTIKKINGIIEAVFIGKYDEDLADEIVYLYVESNVPMTEAELMKQLSKGKYSIDKEALPDHIIFQKIPRKGRQMKIDRVTLKG